MSNTTPQTLSRREVAKRWNTSTTTVDRLRATGRLPWFDVSTRGKRTTVRFRLSDVLAFEEQRNTRPQQ